MTTEEIIATLRDPGTTIPNAALAEVAQRQEEFVPLMIAEIEEATRLAEEADLDDFLASFALYLLAEFRETRALQPILEFFALDGKSEEDLFGNMITQDGGPILAAVGHDNPGALRDYAQRKDISRWVRVAAMEALVRQVQWGEQPREPVVAFFGELIDSNAFGDDGDSWTGLVGACLDFHPRELLDRIRSLYERELIDTWVVGDFSAVEQEAAENLEAHQARGAEHHPPITETARAVSWWQNFERPRRPLHGQIAEQMIPFANPPGLTVQSEPKVGRNDLCPCGSGKKYKKCCLPPG